MSQASTKRLIMISFRSIRRFYSPFLSSKFSIQSNVITCHKPFLRYVTSTTDHRSQEEVSSMDEIAKSVVHLQCESSAEGGVCDVYLVGTCHVSQESSKEVKAVINYLKPQAVFLELCQMRAHVFTEQNFKVPTKGDMFRMWKDERIHPLFIFQSWFTTKTAKELDVHPGAEFRVAYEEARSYGARVYLGDRPYHITMSRLSNEITLWRVIKFLYHTFFKRNTFKVPHEIAKKIEELDDGHALQLMMKETDDRDELTFMFQEMRKAFPALVEIFISERDKYMSQALWRIARKRTSVVAVVGKAHLSGIKKNWMQPVEVQSLLELPSEKDGFGISKIFSSVGAMIGKKSNLEGEEEEDTILEDLEAMGVEPVQELGDEK